MLPAALALAGCTGDDEPRPDATGPVEIAVPAPTGPSVEAVCQAVTQALPPSLGEGLARRPVTGDPDRTAAWGDPAITLACGTGPPGQVGVDGALFALGLPGSTCVDEEPDPRKCVSLLQKDAGPANLFTTYERAVTVSLLVPDEYAASDLAPVLPALVLLPAT